MAADDEKPIHPRVNPDHYRVQAMPERFEEGDVIARYDSWIGEETSQWRVENVAKSERTGDVGYRYRLVGIPDDGVEIVRGISHGELQLLAARNDLRFHD